MDTVYRNGRRMRVSDDELTSRERACITCEQHASIVEWVRTAEKSEGES